MALAQIERDRLITTFKRVGPDAPTLCEGWTSRDLLTHLIMREIYPVFLATDAIPRKHTAKQAELDALSFEDLLTLFERGRQKWNPLRLSKLDSLMNTAEYVVHHEDIRRAQSPQLGRVVAPGEQAEIYKALKNMARLLLRKTHVTVELRAEGFSPIIIGPSPEGGIDVIATGTPLELLMFAFGRSVYHVEFSGQEDKIRSLTRLVRGSEK